VSLATSPDQARPDRLTRLARELGDRLVRPSDPDYDEARQVWSAAVDRRPAAVVRAATVDEVVRTVAFARETGVDLAVRGGGHSMAGHGTVDDGLVLDMGRLQGLWIDPGRRVARIEAGVRAGTYTEAAAAHGLVTPFGDTATVGVVGLTLGGGVGWLSRRLGLTLDSLRSAELVTADGDRVTASAVEHPDLFWAIRGGGGNFGVVTSLELDLHPLGPVYGGALFLPLTRDVLVGMVELAREAPDELTVIAAATHVPPAPFVPPELVGTPTLIVLPVFSGDPDDGPAALDPFRGLATPMLDKLAPMPYPAMYRLTAEGSGRAIAITRSTFAHGLDAAAADAIVAGLADSAGAMTMIQIRVLGGAVARVPDDSTAYAHRDREVLVGVIRGEADLAGLDDARRWAEQLVAAIAPAGTGTYVNFLEDEGMAQVRAAYGESAHGRLVAVKRRWDPTNLFRMNQNIRP